MFSPGTKRPNPGSRKERKLVETAMVSPITPLTENRKPVFDNSVPNRPSTGTPAPWAPRLSVLARISPGSKIEKDHEADPTKPVYVGEFPKVVRDEQASLLQKFVPGEASISGGIDKEASLAWILCRNKLFVWNYLLPVASQICAILELPKDISDSGDIDQNNKDCWLLTVVNWDDKYWKIQKVTKHHNPVGIIMCHKKTRALIYWSDIFSKGRPNSVTSFASFDGSEATSSPVDGKNVPHRQLILNCSWMFNSLIASAIPNSQHDCVALACSSNGELWQFYCSPTGIKCSRVCQDILNQSSQGHDSNQRTDTKGYPRSLIWRFPHNLVEGSERQFFLLTDHEVQCFSVKFFPDIEVLHLWSYEIVGTDSELGIKKDLAGQKKIWPLDMKADEHGKVLTILVATFCKDRVSSSSYTQYSLLTLQYKYGTSTEFTNERVLEKKCPVQVIIQKASVENEDFLFSMRLQVGGKPSGSAIILSGDSTATVAHYYRYTTWLYKFELPYDAGKVLDASILPSTEHSQEGAWVILTEKAGIWAIHEKAVIVGGVEPPERSLSRRGSSNERSAQEERKDFAGNVPVRRVSSEAWDSGDRQRAAMAGVAHQTARDEQSEALLGQLFHNFLLSGQVDASLEKLQSCGAFERDGETNVFTRMSKSIIDTLAKHWTTTRAAEILATTVVSTQLMDKQQRHEKYLQFLALSKCYEELCSKQRYSLQIILEHGEKLAALVQLRQLQNMISQNRSTNAGSSHLSSESQMSGALWDLIQLVGERARRNTVLLMDRDNAEVFYSKVSDLEEVFFCLDKQLEYVLSVEQPYGVQIQRACELANACVSILRTAMHYKSEHQLWYPPPEGLTPWYGQPVVRSGLWRISSFMLQLCSEVSEHDMSAKADLYSHLESLAEVLLEAYAAAITAKTELGEEPKGLLDEYWKRRDELLNSLYQQVKDLIGVRNKGIDDGTIEQNKEILRNHSSKLLSVAKRHGCYSILWNVCCDLNDSVLLRNLMHEGMGPKGGFSYFAFRQLYAKRQFSELLRIGEEFQEDLLNFLKHHPDLLWLHQLFLHQYSSASETLHALALSQDENLNLADEEEDKPNHAQLGMRLADRSRLLNLSKIAAMAEGKNADSEAALMRLDADLKILKVQDEILSLHPTAEANQQDDQKLLHPEQLIRLCLDSEDPNLLLKAFDVFSWTSSSFRRNNRKLLKECWKNAADQDDWSRIYQQSTAEGWSDEETSQNLRNTVLFKASSRCYGPQAEIFEGGFDELLPLRQENSEPSSFPNNSVEGILMQHKDYPEAGKLMLTAIVLGSLPDDSKVEEGPSPME